MADIPITTADTLPRSFGGDREIKRMQLIKFWGWENMEKAENALKKWVEASGYNAVIGVRFLAVPDVSAVSQWNTEPISTEILWTVYGTAIAW
jgi:hypothetical protein